MTVPLWCLLGYVAWTLLLLLGIGATRSAQVLTGARRANEFPSGERHGGDAYWRLNRAHLNCLEFIPLFAAVALVAAVAGVDTPALDRLAVVALVARVGQSTTHLASTSHHAVLVRFSFFVAQVLCLVGMGATLALAV
jgi:uncharacterized MAPEG superfamily protein